MKVANVPRIGTCKHEALKVPMIADPGDRWEYGIDIAPLGMKHTGFILRLGLGTAQVLKPETAACWPISRALSTGTVARRRQKAG